MIYEDLAPRDLFFAQKEAFLTNKMDVVKDMAKVSMSRSVLPKPEDWQEAKKQLDQMSFPKDNDLGWTEVSIAEKHTHKKEVHKLKTYKKWFSILNYEAEAKYNRCEECSKTRNAVIRLYNNELNECYEKWFVYEGRDAEGRDFQQVVKSMFTVFALLLII